MDSFLLCSWSCSLMLQNGFPQNLIITVAYGIRFYFKEAWTAQRAWLRPQPNAFANNQNLNCFAVISLDLPSPVWWQSLQILDGHSPVTLLDVLWWLFLFCCLSYMASVKGGGSTILNKRSYNAISVMTCRMRKLHFYCLGAHHPLQTISTVQSIILLSTTQTIFVMKYNNQKLNLIFALQVLLSWRYDLVLLSPMQFHGFLCR